MQAPIVLRDSPQSAAGPPPASGHDEGPAPSAVSCRSGRTRAWLPGRAKPAGAGRVRARRRVVLAVPCPSVFLALARDAIVNVALPSVSGQLPAATSGLQWTVGGYSLKFAPLPLVVQGPHRSRPLAARQVLTGSDQCGSAIHRSLPPHQVMVVSSPRTCCRRPGGCRA